MGDLGGGGRAGSLLVAAAFFDAPGMASRCFSRFNLFAPVFVDGNDSFPASSLAVTFLAVCPSGRVFCVEAFPGSAW